MHICILLGSPRKKGNTAALVAPFEQALAKEGASYTEIDLAEKEIRPCLGCYRCQDVQDAYGCVQADDVPAVMEEMLRADCLVLATPIYTWYCTAPMKALLDRHYGLNKYYGSATGSLWSGKSLALITTHGYPAESGPDLFAAGMERFCTHSRLRYLGMYTVRDLDNLNSFITPEAQRGAADFARALLSALAGNA